MNKAEKILILLKRGKSTREAAIAVYGPDCDIKTRMSYVRMVKQRSTRKGRERERAWQTAYYHNNAKRNASVRAKVAAWNAAHRRRPRRSETMIAHLDPQAQREPDLNHLTEKT
jgi:hypothetical protein